MADILLCYASKDREQAERLADALKLPGWSVSWDWNLQVGELIPDSFYEELASARCVIVMWSKTSIRDTLVLEVAKEALVSEVLTPVLIEEIETPQGFRDIHALDLTDWDGSESDPDLQYFIDELESKLGISTQSLQKPSSADVEVGASEEQVVTALPAVEEVTSVSERAEEQRDLVYDENVQFTVYRPSSVAAGVWKTLLVFAHLSCARNDDELDPLEEVKRQAEEILREELPSYGITKEDAAQAVPREGTIVFQPIVEGIEFNPAIRSFIWCESVHREEFRMRPAQSMVGKVARGIMSVWLGAILLAEINLAIHVTAKPTQRVPSTRSSVSPYRKLFPSYSHKDSEIVRQFRHYAAALGDNYMQDVIALRSGEFWEPRIHELIDSADIFQLFWSWNAMRSRNVEKEWRFALRLNRPNFLRPVYWESPRPETPGLPPPELDLINFHYIRFNTSELTVPDVPDAGPIPSPSPGVAEGDQAAPDILDGNNRPEEVPDYPNQDSEVLRTKADRHSAATPNHSAAEHDFFRPPPMQEEEQALDWDKTDFVAPVRPEENKADDTESGDHTAIGVQPGSYQPMEPLPSQVSGIEPNGNQPEQVAPIPHEAKPDPPPAADHGRPALSPHEAKALQAFLQGAELKIDPLSPEAGEALMRLQGRLYREIVQGMMDVLRARFELKNEFRMRQTQIQIRENNPLKLLGQVDDALEYLVSKRGSGFLNPEAAFQEAFRDIKDHQVAMVVGMRAAFESLLRRFDPEQLERKFSKGSKIGDYLPMYKKSHYWERFQEWYEDEIKAAAEDDFQGLFGNEFTRAYEDQMAKLALLRRKQER